MAKRNKFEGANAPVGLSFSFRENSIKPLYCGDKELWNEYYQNILKDARLVPDFLPEVKFDGDKVTFYKIEGGKDIISSSKPARYISEKEWVALVSRLEELQAKAVSPDTTADARRFIESFKLPSPTSLDYFRIYKGHLIVLWGFYRENDNSLKALSDVVSKETREELRSNNRLGCRRKILTFLILLLLCLLCLYTYRNFGGFGKSTEQDPAEQVHKTLGGGNVTEPGVGKSDIGKDLTPGASENKDLSELKKLIEELIEKQKDLTPGGSENKDLSELKKLIEELIKKQNDKTPGGSGSRGIPAKILIEPVKLGQEKGKLLVEIRSESDIPGTFSVTDTHGKRVYEGDFPSGKHTSKLPLLDEGVYILKYSTEKTKEESRRFEVKVSASLEILPPRGTSN